MLLYLDNSVLNRPFDDQRQPRIWLETLSFSLVLTLFEAGEPALVRSPIHDLENSRNPFALRRQWVDKCLGLAAKRVSLDESIKARALALERSGFQPLDALHLSCAESAPAAHFLTCDDRLLGRYSNEALPQTDEGWHVSTFADTTESRAPAVASSA